MMLCNYCSNQLFYNPINSYHYCDNHCIMVFFSFGFNMHTDQTYFCKTYHGKDFYLFSTKNTFALLTHDKSITTLPYFPIFRKILDLPFESEVTPERAEIIMDKMVKLLVFS